MIYYPKIFGLCTGASRAIKMAYKLKEEFNKPIYIYKEILHNEYLINKLKDDNIITIYNLNDLKKDDILLLRAHGETKETYKYLEKNNINYYDATCFNVSKIHSLIEEKTKENYKIIIVGKKDHPEVIGSLGWTNDGIVIYSNEDYNLLNKNEKYYVVSQTTISEDKFLNLIKYLKDNNYNFDFDNTICNYQKKIQTSSLELAKNMDLMIIIGGKNSSNTKELFNVCSKACNSYFFSDINEFKDFISNKNINKNKKIGFTGGASTPKEEIYRYANLLDNKNEE